MVTACDNETKNPENIETPSNPEEPNPPTETNPVTPTDEELNEFLTAIQAAIIYTYTSGNRTSEENSLTLTGEITEPTVVKLSELVENEPDAPNVTLVSGDTSVKLINIKTIGGPGDITIYAERQIIDIDVIAQIDGFEEKPYTFHLEVSVSPDQGELIPEVEDISGSLNNKILDLKGLEDEFTSLVEVNEL